MSYKIFGISRNLVDEANDDYRSMRHRDAINAADSHLKQGIWLYLMLLIFEGALRKWVLPALAGPLLIVRDPGAIWILFKVLRSRRVPLNLYIAISVVIGFIGIFTALFLGHGSPMVAFYGARILLIHFPLIFVIGGILTREDVLKIGRTLLWISLPMTVLMALQFYSPQSAWVNRGLGGDLGGAGFDGALGFFRPPGTFSFTTGLSSFYGLCACFIFYFWLYPKEIDRTLLILSTACLIAAIPLSISRTLLSLVGLTFIFTLIAIIRRPKYFNTIFSAVVVVALLIILFGKSSFFQTATEAFTTRLSNANEAEGGLSGSIVERFFGSLSGPLNPPPSHPFFGLGLGMGTNAGSMLLSGKREFLITEGEWGRWIGELGLLMGLLVIFMRVHLCIKLAFASYRQLSFENVLPWLLFSGTVLGMLQGQWAQPTSLGFTTMLGGLVLAALKDSES